MSTIAGANNNELLANVQWELEWSTNNVFMANYVPPISLMLKCIPKPDFRDKLGDVSLKVGLTVYSGEPNYGEIVHDVPSNTVQPIKLTKRSQYQCVLILDPNNISSNALAIRSNLYPSNILLNRFGTHISAKVVIIHMGFPMSGTLRSDLGALLTFDSAMSRSKFSDVVLIALPKKDSNSKPFEFPAHKVILAARSPVFARMFEHDMQESSSNKVKVDDLDPDTLKEMLVYMYTGQVPKIEQDKVAYGLLYAADKYQLDHLKSLCEQHIICRLQVNNASQIIQLAHLHNAPELKRIALQFLSLIHI